MLHVNRATLLGHAGRDPKIRTLPAGGRTASFSLATTERWKRQDGQPAEATEWHRVVVYGGTVKAVEALVRKGAVVMVEGRVAGREFTDREGVDRRITEIVVSEPQGMVNVLSPKPDEDAGAESAAQGNAGAGDAPEAGAGDAAGAEESAGADAQR